MIALSLPPRAVVGDGLLAPHDPSDDFLAFSEEDLLVDIDFDDLFVDFDDGDLLPDLDLDSDGPPAPDSPSAPESGSSAALDDPKRVGPAQPERGRKSSHGKKKKGKVDWTPELHRRFVQAVEQLGVDKAVPSRILEVMGIDCLTRHNIASHLQKYRSHRKHMLARDAETASWSHRRQAPAAVEPKKREMAPWANPTMGFPPPLLPSPAVQPFRPLHVWGHPTVGHAMVHMWPKHMVPSRPPPPQGPPPPPPPPPIWAPPQPPNPDPSFWHHPPYHGGPNILTQGTPCFPHQQLAAAPAMQRFPVPHFQAMPRQPMLSNNKAHNHLPLTSKQLQLDSLPSKESIDAALGDVLSKPWLPLPLGLKPPSVESVLGELQKQGVSKIPPSCA